MSTINNLFTLGQLPNGKTIERYKEEFYLGKVSRVYKDKCYVQTDNFSLLKTRINRSDFVIPNTINYLVVIENITGVFLAEVVGSQLSDGSLTHDNLINDSDNLHPIIQIKLIGFYQNDKFVLPGFATIGIGDRVYIATKKIKEIYQSSLEITNKDCDTKDKLSFANISFFGEQNIPFKISPNGLLSNHFMIMGATNSGKSTSALSILDELYKQKIKFVLIDPTGEYSSAFKNEEIVESLVLGENTWINTKKITDAQWLMLFNPNTETQEQQLLAAINELKVAQSNLQNQIVDTGIIKKENNSVEEVEKILKAHVVDDQEIDVSRIVDQLQNDAVKETRGEYIFDDFKNSSMKWLIDQVNYRLDKLKLNTLLTKGEEKKQDLIEELSQLENNDISSLYLNASKVGITNDSGKMVIDLLCNELLSKRRKKRFEQPNCTFRPIILFIDEVHRYALEKDSEGNYSSGLINIAREGRKYGLFLFLTSQSPKDVPSIILNQIGTLLVHNLTGKDDLKIISNYFDEATLNSLSLLGQGEAILSGVNFIKSIQLKIRRSVLTHNNETPYIGK